MKKTILEIYALAVCFFTVACLVVVCGMALWNLVEIAAPEFTITNYQFDCHQSDEAYRDCQSGNLKYTRKESPVAFPEGEALTSERLSAYDSVLKAERRSALQSLVKKFIVILVSAAVFFAHWRLARHAREQAC